MWNSKRYHAEKHYHRRPERGPLARLAFSCRLGTWGSGGFWWPWLVREVACAQTVQTCGLFSTSAFLAEGRNFGVLGTGSLTSSSGRHHLPVLSQLTAGECGASHETPLEGTVGSTSLISHGLRSMLLFFLLILLYFLWQLCHSHDNDRSRDPYAGSLESI